MAPLTPRLDDRTRSDLVAGLGAAGVPDVAAQSVVLALAAVLGFEAADHRFAYRMPHRHLPEVDAVATRDGPACATVRATVRLAEPAAEAVVDGRYCVAAGAMWHATRQAVAPACRPAVPPDGAGC